MAKSPRKMVPKFYWDLKIAKKRGQRRQRRGVREDKEGAVVK